MCKFLPFSHFYGRVIVPVLAMVLAFPGARRSALIIPRPKAPASSSSTSTNPNKK